jgi:hypothetical protein
VKLLMQCPGCWSVSENEPKEGAYFECGCGEKLTVIDLRDDGSGDAPLNVDRGDLSHAVRRFRLPGDPEEVVIAGKVYTPLPDPGAASTSSPEEESGQCAQCGHRRRKLEHVDGEWLCATCKGQIYGWPNPPTPEQPEDGKATTDELERGARELGIEEEAPRNRADELRAAAEESDDPNVTRRYLDALHAAQPEQPEEPTCETCGDAGELEEEIGGRGEHSGPCPDCTRQEPSCGGSGYLRVEGAPVPGHGHIGVPESEPCPGCKDCSTQESGGEEEVERWTVDYENAEGEPQHAVLSWLSTDPTKELPEVGTELVRRDDLIRAVAGWEDALRQVTERLTVEREEARAERDSRLTKESVREKLRAWLDERQANIDAVGSGTDAARAASYVIGDLQEFVDATFGDDR